jgi:hypothetical protein
MQASTAAHFVGLDLGQSQDFTALAVLERTKVPDRRREDRLVCHYAVRHLQRFLLGTAYTDVATYVCQLFDKPPLRDSILAVDFSGVGRPVVDMLRRFRFRARVIPITITSGHKISRGGTGAYGVPKKDLVGTLQVLLQSRRIKVAPALSEAQVLVKELQGFQTKITQAGNEIFGAPWREGKHDDLVLAVALAAWLGENWVEPYTGPLVYNSWVPWPDDTNEDNEKPKSRLQQILDELGIDLDGD